MKNNQKQTPVLLLEYRPLKGKTLTIQQKKTQVGKSNYLRRSKRRLVWSEGIPGFKVNNQGQAVPAILLDNKRSIYNFPKKGETS